ncbi:MAG: hypothetical protein ACLSVD_02060, partial [Eggerthellaceae bacterium]
LLSCNDEPRRALRRRANHAKEAIMGLDEELETIEDGAETEAEQIDEETEIEDVEEFQDDEEFGPRDEETDLEEAYEGFFAEEGPDGEGETSPSGDDGGLAAVVERKSGLDLSEEGFHIVDGDEGTEAQSTRTARSTATMPMR